MFDTGRRYSFNPNMKEAPILGLTHRIVISLAVILGLFILITYVSIEGLTRATVQKRFADAADSSDKSEETEHDLAALRSLILFYLVTGAAVALFLGALVIRRQVSRPVRRVNDALSRVASGMLDTTVPLEGARELVELGMAFNGMTSTLKAQRESIESRVREIEAASLKLEETTDRLIRTAKLASVGALAAGVAHEIGNPLAGILGLLETMDREGPDDSNTRSRYLSLMRKEIERIDRIIRDLLSYARAPRSGEDAGSRAHPAKVMDHVLALLKSQALFDHVDLKASIPEDTLALFVPADDLTQLLLNLFLNAAQAMEGKGTIEVEVAPTSLYQRRPQDATIEAIEIRVTDSGPGIDAEDREKIFDPFFTRRKSGAGIGLGLAICQNICDRAGGDIALDGSHGNGARFIVTLPIAAKFSAGGGN